MKRLIICEDLGYPKKSIEVKRHRMVAVNIDENNGVCDKVNPETGLKMIQVRNRGEFKGHALYLNDCYDWVIGEDSEGLKCLVPLKKVK